jgi:flagellar biosynthesis/type III secretory pathway chaperone
MTATDRLFQQLQRHLREQEEVIDRLVAAGEDQLQALRDNNLDRLYEITGQQEALSVQIRKNEEGRLAVQGMLENGLQLPPGTTFKELIAHAPVVMKTPLEQLYGSLRRKMADLKEVNYLCAVLIKKALLVNNRIVQILNAGGADNYGQKGELKKQLPHRPVLNESV